MRDPILVTLSKMRPHYSQSTRENATPSSGTPPLASYKEVTPPPPSPRAAMLRRLSTHEYLYILGSIIFLHAQGEGRVRGFIKGRAPGKLTGCEHDFAWLLYISKNFFLIQGTINNSFKLQSCPFLDESYRV